MNYKYILFFICCSFLLVSCGGDDNEISLNDSDLTLPERPDTPRPTVFAAGSYLDGLSTNFVAGYNVPMRSGNKLSDEAAFCFADNYINNATEEELSEAGITDKNIVTELDRVIEISREERNKILFNCFEKNDIAIFLAENSSYNVSDYECGIDKIGLEKVRQGLTSDYQNQILELNSQTKLC